MEGLVCLTNPASVAGRLARLITNQRVPLIPARPGHCTRWLGGILHLLAGWVYTDCLDGDIELELHDTFLKLWVCAQSARRVVDDVKL